jgi:hypothetical protein
MSTADPIVQIDGETRLATTEEMAYIEQLQADAEPTQ